VKFNQDYMILLDQIRHNRNLRSRLLSRPLDVRRNPIQSVGGDGWKTVGIRAKVHQRSSCETSKWKNSGWWAKAFLACLVRLSVLRCAPRWRGRS